LAVAQFAGGKRFQLSDQRPDSGARTPIVLEHLVKEVPDFVSGQIHREFRAVLIRIPAPSSNSSAGENQGRNCLCQAAFWLKFDWMSTFGHFYSSANPGWCKGRSLDKIFSKMNDLSAISSTSW
jgi:hypothetical protein